MKSPKPTDEDVADAIRRIEGAPEDTSEVPGSRWKDTSEVPGAGWRVAVALSYFLALEFPLWRFVCSAEGPPRPSCPATSPKPPHSPAQRPAGRGAQSSP